MSQIEAFEGKYHIRKSGTCSSGYVSIACWYHFVFDTTKMGRDVFCGLYVMVNGSMHLAILLTSNNVGFCTAVVVVCTSEQAQEVLPLMYVHHKCT